MLAIRSSLVIAGLDEAAYEAARTTAADAVTIDLATPSVHERRAAVRRVAAKHATTIAAAGRPVHARVSDTRSGELEADLAAVVGDSLAAVVLSGAETAQDARDADVAIRREEMRLGIDPGTVRLIPQIDSAAGLRALPSILGAVDRHDAVSLDLDALGADLGLPDAASPAFDHAMWDVATAARAAGLPWTVAAGGADLGRRAAFAARAQQFGAAGAYAASEAEVRGLNALFTPRPEAVADARRAVELWERLRARDERVGVSDGALVDRRRVRRARSLMALAGAIARREHV